MLVSLCSFTDGLCFAVDGKKLLFFDGGDMCSTTVVADVGLVLTLGQSPVK